MPDISIRPMGLADLPVVGTLAAELVRQHHGFDAKRFFLEEPVDEGYRWFFAKELERENAVLEVALIGSHPIAYSYGTIEPRDWSKLLDAHGAIHDIYVHPDYRKRGIARKLMESTTQRLRKHNVTNIVLYSASQNVEAQALFKSLGYRPTMVEMTLVLPR